MSENEKVVRDGNKITYIPDLTVTDSVILNNILSWCKHYAKEFSKSENRYELGYKEACETVMAMYEYGMYERNGGTYEVTKK